MELYPHTCKSDNFFLLLGDQKTSFPKTVMNSHNIFSNRESKTRRRTEIVCTVLLLLYLILLLVSQHNTPSPNL